MNVSVKRTGAGAVVAIFIGPWLARFAFRRCPPKHDETDYLLRSPANASEIFGSIDELRRGEGIEFSVGDLREDLSRARARQPTKKAINT